MQWQVTMWPILALGLAVLEMLAVWKGLRQIEILAKPGAMIALFFWLAAALGLSGPPLWFGLGILFSLAGDVLLLWPERWFLPALVAFLLAHLAYLVGFNMIPPALSAWSLLTAVVIGLGAARILRRILTGLHASGNSSLALPVAAYGAALTLMLLSALLTLSNPLWEAQSSVSVALGAALFFLSDNLLAWNRFVSPIKRGCFMNIYAYEMGQILLIGGVIRQFSAAA